MLCVPALEAPAATVMVAAPLLSVLVPMAALPLLASSRVTLSPLGTPEPPLTVTVNVTAWLVVEGLGVWEVIVVAVAVSAVETVPPMARSLPV